MSSPQAVSKWETGQSLPDIGNLLKLSWLFRTSINHILEGSRPVEAVSGVDRKNLLLDTLLRCPQCRSALRLTVQNGRLAYGCTNGHADDVVDGVVDFKTREIPGEQWSLSYRNYEAYLMEHRLPGNPNYRRGIDSTELIWKILEEQRPRNYSGYGLRYGARYQTAAWQDQLAGYDSYGGYQSSNFEMEQPVLRF